MVEEPTELLDKDKSPKATNRASKKASGASKEAQNDGGRRKTGVQGKGEEVSPSSHGSQRAETRVGFFRREGTAFSKPYKYYLRNYSI